MSPALGLYFNWGPMSIATGPIAPLIYMLALLISLPTAISYAMVSKEIPAAGQAYTWLWYAFLRMGKLTTGYGMLFNLGMGCVQELCSYSTMLEDCVLLTYFLASASFSFCVSVVLFMSYIV